MLLYVLLTRNQFEASSKLFWLVQAGLLRGLLFYPEVGGDVLL
jgi:hypothetical protein